MLPRSGYTISSPTAVLTVLLTVGFLFFGATSLQAQKFEFGPGAEKNIYSAETGYGFEPGTKITCIDRMCTSDQPFYFSVRLPEGNYNVTVTLAGESVTTIKAELRRLMLEKVETKRGRFETRTFTVNVRTPQIAGDGEVKLKDREKTTEIWAWDEKLTLEFNGSRPAIAAIEITPANVPTIYLLGDSTVADQPREPYNSWGQMLTRFFRPGVAIANHAESGESLRSSLAAKRLDKVLSIVRPGDYLFIQYGHNDEKEKGEGVGAFTTYKSDLKKFVAEARARKASPVLITPVQRRTFDQDQRITNSHGDYPEAVRQVAKEENVALIDLNAMSKTLYEAWGPEPSKRAFAPNDNTHHNNYGSYELAKCIVEGIRANKLGLGRYLIKDLPRFDPSRPDLFESIESPTNSQQSINPRLPTIFVVGDSTANNDANGGRGWGDPFIDLFDTTKVNVLNRARAGRSSRTFITQGWWDYVLREMKRGDLVLIQFGHNDAGAINDASRARGSLPGTGEETQEIDNLLTKEHEVVHTYGWYLRKMIADTEAKSAIPIVLSLTVRNIWKDGHVERGSGKFGQWANEVATSQHVQFLDVTKLIADKYEQLGEAKVKDLFATDHTHTNPAGAELNASLILTGLQTLKGRQLDRLLNHRLHR